MSIKYRLIRASRFQSERLRRQGSDKGFGHEIIDAHGFDARFTFLGARTSMICASFIAGAALLALVGLS